MFTSQLRLRPLAEIRCNHSNKEWLAATNRNNLYLENMMMIVVPQPFSSDHLPTIFLYRQRILLLPCYTTTAFNFIFYLFMVIDSPISYFNILCFLRKELLKNRENPEINIYIGFENHSYRKFNCI